MRTGLTIIIILGVLLALFPVIANIIDTMLYGEKQSTLTTTTTPTETVSGIKILVPEVVSQTGADRLVVSPGKAVVPPNYTIDVDIRVYFKHSQPCPYSDWHVNYTVQGGLEVISDDGGKLVDSKTYERILKVRVLGYGIITVTYYYGTGCPEGTMEQVKVELTTSTENMTVTETETPITTTIATTTTEETTYINVSGTVESKDLTYRLLQVSDKAIYVRGEWIVQGTNQTLESTEVVEQIPTGAYVTVTCKLTDSGRLQATKIIVNNETVYIRS